MGLHFKIFHKLLTFTKKAMINKKEKKVQQDIYQSFELLKNTNL